MKLDPTGTAVALLRTGAGAAGLSTATAVAIGLGALNIAMAPEGTRSRTGAVGPFKTGAFQVAQQAGVPVVPVVLRGTGTLMPPGSLLVHTGTVQVAVLEPVDTSGWVRDDFHQRVEAVRQHFVDTLEHWPEPARRV